MKIFLIFIAGFLIGLFIGMFLMSCLIVGNEDEK